MTLKDVTVKFAGLTAVNKLSFRIPEGSIYSVIGPNGAGKTTVFNCISRFYTPVSGEITFQKENLLTVKPHNVIQMGIARSFQNVELFSKMTVLENLLTGMHPVLKHNIFSIIAKTPSIVRGEKKARKRAYEVLELLGISDYAHEYVTDLPFGYQKMVDIGHAMMTDPKLLMLDEPVAGMNPMETERIKQLVLTLKEEMGYTILLIEHDMSLVMEVSDYLTVVNFGQKIAEGLPEDIQNNPDVVEAYLGEEAPDVNIN